jgi:hypothetical protein
MSYACDFDEIAPLPNIIDSLSLLLELKFSKVSNLGLGPEHLPLYPQ